MNGLATLSLPKASVCVGAKKLVSEVPLTNIGFRSEFVVVFLLIGIALPESFLISTSGILMIVTLPEIGTGLPVSFLTSTSLVTEVLALNKYVI